MQTSIPEIQRQLGTARYIIEGGLGGGGMGEVFKAFDQERREVVALKLLKRNEDRASIYRFKREFRSLSGVVHPNLVTLYELHGDGDVWFFTMEAVEGKNFLEHVCGEGWRKLQPHTSSYFDAATMDISEVPPIEEVPPVNVEEHHFDAEELESCLGQLALGLDALHSTGHLHRDIKPTNVLVDSSGRVVILDFGIITELAGSRSTWRDAELLGTPLYIAPELLRNGTQATTANDWYAVGVILYLALAGRSPYHGGTDSILLAKLRQDPLSLRERPIQSSERLVSLCEDLLNRDPALRPGGQEVLNRLSDGLGAVKPHHARPPRRRRIIGREEERETLSRALEDAQSGTGRVVLVGGKSGMGKSSLIEEFLETAQTAGTIVLSGRCYERESVPFKALDALVDNLSDTLLELPEDVVRSVVPADAGTLVAAFPVLVDVPLVAEVIEKLPEVEGESTVDLQRRALASLRELLLRLAVHRTLVISIDDLQWGDVDSVPFVSELMRPSKARMLFLASYRSENVESSAALAGLLTMADGSGTDVVARIEVGELGDAQIAAIAQEVAPGAGADTVAAIVEEAQGIPLFAHELARFSAMSGAHSSMRRTGMSLEQVIGARVERLLPEAEALLEIVVVAGRKVPQFIALHAAQLEETGQKALLELEAEQFVKSSGSALDDVVEPYHDRIRELVVAQLSEEAERRCHRMLAHSYEKLMTPGPERTYALAHHYYRAEESGSEAKAFNANWDAGNLAAEAHAYEQAFEYLDQAREVAERDGHALNTEFHRQLGKSAARMGRMEYALREFRTVLERATTPLTRAEAHFEISKVALGQLDTTESRREAGKGLKQLGRRPPRSSLLSLLLSVLDFLLVRHKLKRDYRVTADATERPYYEALIGLYTHIGFTAYFQMDPISMIQTILRNLRPALALGLNYHLAEWSILASVVCAILRKRAWSEAGLRRAVEVAAQLGNPILQARVDMFHSIVEHFLGEPIEAQRTMVRCLSDSGHLLENQDYLTGVADLSWNTMMRGHPQVAWTWLQSGLQRANLASGQLSEGHTYRCYAGPVLAMLGRPEEGASHLADFKALIDSHPPDRWRNAQYRAHRTLYCLETLALGDSFEEVVRVFLSMGINPGRLPQQIRHVYVAECYGRLRHLEVGRDTGLRAALKRLKKSTRGHPTLMGHWHVISAGAARHKGDGERATEHLGLAEAVAARIDAPWILYEAAMERARAGGADRDEAQGRAIAIAREREWPLRLERAEELS